MKLAKNNITRIFSIAIIVSGLLATVGLFAGFTIFVSDPLDIKINSAFCFLLIGVILYFISLPNASEIQIKIYRILAAIVLFIGITTMMQYLLHFNLGIDELFLKGSSLDKDNHFPGRMSGVSAFSFSILGIIFYFLKNKHWHLFIQLLLFLLVPGLLQALFYYIFGTEVLKFIPQFSVMSIFSVIIFFLIIIAIIFSAPLNNLKIAFYIKIVSIFILIILVLLLIFYAMDESNRNSIKTVHQGMQAQQILKIKNDTYDLARDIESSTMQYIITGSETSLEPYHNASKKLMSNIIQLRKLAKTRYDQFTDFDTLEDMVAYYLTERNQIIVVRRTKGFKAAKILFDRGSTKKLMNKLISVLAGFEAAEYRQLQFENLANEKDINNSTRIIKIFQLTIGFFLIFAFIIIYRNVNQKNNALRLLKKGEQFVRSIINSIKNPICVRDLSGNYLLVNSYLEERFNKSAGQIIGEPISKFYPKPIADKFKKDDDEIIQDKIYKESELQLEFNDGLHYFINSRFPLFDENNNIYAVGTVSTDITNIKLTQEALHNSNVVNKHLQSLINNLQHLMETSSDVICIFDTDGRFTRVSSTCEKLWGYTAEEITGEKYINLVHEDDVPKTQKVESELLNGGFISEFENRYKRKNGDWITTIWTCIWSEEDQSIYAIARDGTEKRLTLENLKKSRQLLLQAEEMAHVGSWEMDLATGKTEWSDEFYRICGLIPGSITPGRENKLAMVHPDYRDIVKNNFEKAVNTGGSYRLKKLIVRPDGVTRVIYSQARCITNKEGLVHKIIGIYHDITEREENEQMLILVNKQLEEKAIDLEKTNAELERFAFATSHDLNEPLRMVSSFMGLLEAELDGKLNDTSKQYLHFAKDGAKRMQAMIKNLLTYSRLGSKNDSLFEVDCMDVVKKVQALLALEIKEKNVQITIQPLPLVNAGYPKMLQLFQNLIGNAIKYNDKSLPQIEIGCSEEGNMWKFHVKDNGIGIDPNYFEKIFVIFQRLHTQDEFSGSGIGLSLCKKIIENYGGNIWLESEKGKGSAFYFTLPRKAE